MTINFDSKVVRHLLDDDDPIPRLGEQLHAAADVGRSAGVFISAVDDQDVSVAALRGAIERALQGNISAARELTDEYVNATEQLSAALGTSDRLTEGVRLALRTHLFRLPLLATIHREPLISLYQWALVGLREAWQSPVPYPRTDVIDASTLTRFSRALSAAMDESEDVQKLKDVFAVSNEDIGKWTEVSSQAVSAWSRAKSAPKARAQRRLDRLVRLSEVFSEVIKSERVPAVFRASSVPLLDGLTYFEALNQGWDVDVLIDIVGQGAGRRAETEAGSAFLDGPHAPALSYLARYRERDAIPIRATTRGARVRQPAAQQKAPAKLAPVTKTAAKRAPAVAKKAPAKPAPVKKSAAAKSTAKQPTRAGTAAAKRTTGKAVASTKMPSRAASARGSTERITGARSGSQSSTRKSPRRKALG